MRKSFLILQENQEKIAKLENDCKLKDDNVEYLKNKVARKESAMREMVSRLGDSVTPSFAQRNNAGIVKMAPAASDSPAEPMVCTMLLSKIESLRMITRMTAMEITAAGMEADTVMPTRSPK